MDNAQLYLIKKIVGHEKNGLNSLGHLNGKHIEDIARVMTDFAKEVLSEVIVRINKGEPVDVDGMVIKFNNNKKRKRK